MRLPFFFAISLAWALSAPAALAGDAAEIDVLGFSEGGAVFAFEEYGVQDGSGFPYANRFYIDTATDEFLAGTPIRTRLEEDGATLEQARAKAAEAGDRIVPDAVLRANRGYLAGFNAIGEISADPLRLEVIPRPIFPAMDDPLEFRLEQFALPKADCAGMGDPTMGFRLTRSTGGASEVLHEDKTVPQSRGCPVAYRLGGVQTYFNEGGESVFAVLVTVARLGFEGPDHRWIAVTGRW